MQECTKSFIILEVKPDRISQNKTFFYHDLIQFVLKRILFVKKPKYPSHFFARCLFYFVLFILGLSFFNETNFAQYPNGSYSENSLFVILINNVNLVFHEAGHTIFGFFGKFMRIFGGTLLQCVIPLIVMTQFLRQQDNFEASIGLWWFGENFIDIAPYIYDAWDRKLILLGGMTGREMSGHDWYNLLTMMNHLDKYAEIANVINNLGKLIMFLAFVWGGVVLYKTFIVLRSHVWTVPSK